MFLEALWGFFPSLALAIHILLLHKLYFQKDIICSTKNMIVVCTTASTATMTKMSTKSEYKQLL